MKIKIACILIIVLFFVSTIQVNADKDFIDIKNFNISKIESKEIFSELKINDFGDFLTLDIDKADNYLSIPGKPMLPVYIKSYHFPINTKIYDVECIGSDISYKKLEGKIKPASYPNAKNYLNKNIELLDNKVYSSKELFPKNIFDYKISRGIIKNEDKIILDIYFYLVRYSPYEDKIYQFKNLEIKISYQNTFTKKSDESRYDMVIICPKVFEKDLQRLVNHKNKYSINTTIKTTNSIYRESSQGKYEEVGRDKQEQIKYFIKWAKDNWHIKYVLLVGGRVGQLLRWHVPVRYVYLEDGSDLRHISDLYYSDLYRYNEDTEQSEFEDWDLNNNGIFAEYNPDINNSDKLDLYPDVKLGRLACRNKIELNIVIDKIINYEKNTFGSDWFKNFTVVGGDTVPVLDNGEIGFYEGEIETGLSASYLEPIGFNIKELFISSGNYTGSQDLIDAFNQGMGFIHLSGHGNPSAWTTYPPDSNDQNDSVNYSFLNFEMSFLENIEMLPICVIGACHSNQFDVSILNFFRGIITEGLFKYFSLPVTSRTGGFWKGEWSSRCWGWNLIVQKNGGSVATIGNTGVGFGESELNCTKRTDGYITTRFFYNYQNLTNIGINNLGDIHSQTVSDYISNIYIPNIFDDESWADLKTIQGWALLGDPSLEIGGYPPID